MPQHLNDAKHWRDRAKEMRRIADGYSNSGAARIMYRLADDYDKLADRADRRTASGLKPLPSAVAREPHL
jgi:hypothetical protein